MKVKSITITGMHKVDKKTYTFNDGITYFIGENGAGKSTILEATQLALLGYIPGYAKTNESIMKHASGPVMSVEAELEGDIKITRTWTRSGASVKSTVDVTGYEGELTNLMGKVDLPVFDFNEFRSMTSNKLKDWFISFLPSSSEGLNIKKSLKDAMGTRAIPFGYLIDETEAWIKTNNLKGLELVRSLNTKFKDDQSFCKGQIANLEGTIKSLIKYDDAEDLDSADISAKIKTLSDNKTQTIEKLTAIDSYIKASAVLEDIKKTLPAATFADDPRVTDLTAKIEAFQKKNEVLKADYQDLNSQVQALQQQKLSLQQQRMRLTKSADTCPFTKEFCQTAADLANKTEEEGAAIDKQVVELDKQISFKTEEMKEYNPSIWTLNDRTITQYNSELGGIQAQYARVSAMQIQIDSMSIETDDSENYRRDLTEELQGIDEELRHLQEQLVKIEANKRYIEFSDKVTADKFKYENELAVFKEWTKLTDANGLQTVLMNKPFEDLATEMSSYLSQMFNKPITAKFNLISKANSFSFGLESDGKYIEFDYLSSGERCLFTLALIMCILNKSESQIRTILIDDILDHLDSANADYLFGALKGVTDIQFILAGVKECSDSSICKSV